MIEFFRQVWALARPYKFRMFLGVLAGSINGLTTSMLLYVAMFVWSVMAPKDPKATAEPLKFLPQFMRNWLDDARTDLGAGVHAHPAALWCLIALIPAVALLRAASGYLNVYFLQWAGTRTVADLRVKLFSHLLNLSAQFYTKNATGELVSRVMSDTQQLQTIVTGATAVIVRDPVQLISLLMLLFVQQGRLACIAIVVLPVCIVPIAIYSRKTRRSSREGQTRMAEVVETMAEGFTGHRVIKAYNLENVVTERFRESVKRTVSLLMRLTRVSEMPGTIVEFLGACGIALTLVYLNVYVEKGAQQVDFIQLLFTMVAIYGPMKNLTKLQNQVVQARAATERVFEMLAMSNSVPEPAAPKMLHADKADIVFENLDFDYGDKNKPALRNINLTIKAGQMVALVGESGSGKTTMANLVLRFYDPVGGTVKIGGVDLREVRTEDLRKQIAVVSQENILFNDTIRRNIELGKLGATDEEIKAAARFAKADQFIADKKEGYDTPIGEKGSMLSGGQRQRIAIARAVLRNAPILILDEATSALDPEVEREVQAELDRLMQGRTTLCIAHRLTTVINADVIVVMDKGRIVEQGRHEDLIKRGGVYQRLYQPQLRS